MNKFIETIRSIAPWAPIPLFAESLRVQRELISAVMTRHSIAGVLTGCIRDFHRLWSMDYLELFGPSPGQRPSVVASVRHGNFFDLANEALVKAAGILDNHSLSTTNSSAADIARETFVYVTFITPQDPAVLHQQSWADRRWWGVICVFLLEVASTTATAVYMGKHGQLLASCLLICVIVSHMHTFVLRLFIDPIFGNQAAVQSDRVQTARNGAALDVHVVADSWNSSRISVLCGYSSHLHALTNIPIRTTRPFLLKWLCRSLAVVLTTQAALLAAVANADGNDRWASLLWFGLYVAIALLKKLFHVVTSPQNLLEKQPASVTIMDPLHFSGRRAALVFISMLPVSPAVSRWDWWDVFMPDNDRRREFHSEIKRSPLFSSIIDWKGGIGSGSVNTDISETNSSRYTIEALEEATRAFESEPFKHRLQHYLSAVLPDEAIHSKKESI